MLLKDQSTVILKCENSMNPYSFINSRQWYQRCHLSYYVCLMAKTVWLSSVQNISVLFFLYIYTTPYTKPFHLFILIVQLYLIRKSHWDQDLFHKQDPRYIKIHIHNITTRIIDSTSMCMKGNIFEQFGIREDQMQDRLIDSQSTCYCVFLLDLAGSWLTAHNTEILTTLSHFWS